METETQRIYALEQAIQGVLDAVDRPGVSPEHHRRVVARTWSEWPTLEARVEQARRVLRA